RQRLRKRFHPASKRRLWFGRVVRVLGRGSNVSKYVGGGGAEHPARGAVIEQAHVIEGRGALGVDGTAIGITRRVCEASRARSLNGKTIDLDVAQGQA